MEDVRPTAKWANRMLRPLTSIYHRLEKHNEIVTSVLISKAKERTDAALDAEQMRLTTEAPIEHACSYSDDEEPNDPAWIPGKLDKRKIRHNYSSRRRGNGVRKRSRLLIRSPEVPKTLPGAIEIATPLITGKIRGPLAECSPSLRVQLFQNRLSGADNRGSSEHRKTGRTNNSSFPPYQGSWKEVLDQSGDPGLVDIAHLLDRIFLKFLKYTRVTPTHSKGHVERGQRGARSLLSMAVRRLPEFIADEQRIQDESDEGCEVDMCDAYFTELEAAYAPNNNGWQPLREAVRAQGIYLVSCIIQRQWITSPAAYRLLEESLSHGEFDALESLLTPSLAIVDAYHYPAAFDPSRPRGHRDDLIHILGTYHSRCPARRSYVFKELSRLLTRGVVPPEWMVTTMWKRCVDGAIKSVSTEDYDYPAARRLIEAVVLSAAGIYSTMGSKGRLTSNHNQSVRPVRARGTQASTTHTSVLSKDQFSCPIPIQDALSNLIASLLTALCGMCLARSRAAEAAETSAGLKTREMVNCLAFTVQRVVGNEPATLEPDGPIFHPLRRGYVLLADYTLHCGNNVTAEIIYHSESVSRRNIKTFFRSLASRQDVVRELARHVSQVFHHSGHAHGQGPTRMPTEVRARVSQLAHLSSAQGVALLLGKVAAETAMQLAEKSLDPDDHTWAVEIQEQAASSQQEEVSQQSPSSSQLNSSLYRWEDSIGEWVARRPAVNPRPFTTVIATKQPVRRRGRPRIIACSTSSSSTSSVSSENTISSATSSAPSVSRKRCSTSQDSSPRPLKKTYHTRSVERAVSKASHWADVAGGPCKPSPEAMHVLVAARTRTGVRDSLQRNTAGQEEVAIAREANSVEPISRIEVVIVNKSPPRPTTETAAPKDNIRPIRRRARRHSAFLPRTSPRLSQRRKSAPMRVTQRRTVIPCSQDNNDSDDELSFL
ncbi:hypothetical protein BDW59DRAFT_144668 [Aspergillus cavernicola]|uniref:Uncharacterized protein n=1 Tax=Aspergillus cavernicola TaxID=176166 RepID=A0ABR4IIN6_9EURO